MNINKIDKLVLGDLRQRLGAEDENDTSRDELIAIKAPAELFDEYCGWHLGDASWGAELRRVYAMLQQAARDDE